MMMDMNVSNADLRVNCVAKGDVNDEQKRREADVDTTADSRRCFKLALDGREKAEGRAGG